MMPTTTPSNNTGGAVAASQAGGGGPGVAATTAQLAAMLGGTLVGRGDIVLTGLDAVDKAGPNSLTFIRSSRYAGAWAGSKAGAALVTRTIEVPGHDPQTRALILVDDADLAMIALLEKLTPPLNTPEAGVDASAIVHPTAMLGRGVRIGPQCIVGPGCVIGDGCVLHAQVYLGAQVRLGAGTVLHAGVRVLDRCGIGAQCILWPGVIIGADGFGYRPSPDKKGLIKIPHMGTVEIGNAVEIGANSCVDRGKFGATTIGDGTKIDNLVQIGHNCRIGRGVIVCGMCGIGGSTVVEDGVVLAGHVGISDNLTVGRGATITAKSGVLSNVPAGETWFGTPAGPHKDQMRAFAALRKLSDHLRMLRKIEKSLHADTQE